MDSRVSVLKAELSALKQEAKEKALAVKRSQQWVSIKKRLPVYGELQGSIRAIVWANDGMESCWFDPEKIEWHRYNGTWRSHAEDRIEGVTHWMGTDWMYESYWPQYGPGIIKYLRHLWSGLSRGATSMAYDLRPTGWGSKAQLGHKPNFYIDRKTGEIMTGGPEHARTPKGYERVTCTSALEAERWSAKQRSWDKAKHYRIQEERAPIEEAKHAEIRAEMHHRMANARNNTNREFMRRAIEKSDQKGNPWRYERESYLHSEAHEIRNR